MVPSGLGLCFNGSCAEEPTSVGNVLEEATRRKGLTYDTLSAPLMICAGSYGAISDILRTGYSCLSRPTKS